MVWPIFSIPGDKNKLYPFITGRDVVFFEFKVNHHKQYSILGSNLYGPPATTLINFSEYHSIIPILIYFIISIGLPFTGLYEMASANKNINASDIVEYLQNSFYLSGRGSIINFNFIHHPYNRF